MKKTVSSHSDFQDRQPRDADGWNITRIRRPKSVYHLPSPRTKRWVIRRKAEVVLGVRSGLLTLDEACKRYNLSVEEFLSWQSLIDRYGVRGLRTTRLQKYRRRSG